MMQVRKCFRLLLTMCIACAALGMGGCSLSGKKPSATAQPNSQVTYIEGADFVGVVKAVDKEANTVTLYNTSFEGTDEYTYSGATEIYSKNDRDMVMEENYAGTIVIGFFAVVAFFVCIAFRKKIQVLLDRFYEKITK